MKTHVPAIVVYGTCILMLVGVLAAIALWGRNLPLSEDWLTVAPLTGHEPDLLGWLWSQNNEHRLPLPRLLYLLVLKLSGGDFRSGMVFNTLVLGGLSCAFVHAARYTRGGEIRYSDAFFPLVLLHLGHWENLVWGWQIQFVVSVALSCVLLLVIVTERSLPTPRGALLASATLMLLPLSGANGVVIALVLSPWFALLGFLRLRSAGSAGRPRGPGGLLLASALAAVFLCGLYFVGLEPTPWNPSNSGILAGGRTAAKLLAFGFGPIASRSWPLSVLAVAVLLLSSVILLARPSRRIADAEWPRRLGLLVFLGAGLGLSLVIGWGRAGAPPQPGWELPIRYALFTVPVLCVAYFAWTLYGPPRLRTRVGWVLLVVAVVLVPLNMREGFRWRDWYVAEADRVLQDLEAGVPLPAIAERHQSFLLHWNREFLLSRLEMLQESGMGPFRSRNHVSRAR